MRLRIGKHGFSLPLELVTSTQAILARKRNGKSDTASVEAEELLSQKQQLAAIDPTGAWWELPATDRALQLSCSAAITRMSRQSLTRGGHWLAPWLSMAFWRF